MKTKYLMVLFFLLIPLYAIASSLLECKVYPFLKQDLNTVDFKKCQTSLKKCVINGISLDLTCANKIMKQKSTCQQLHSLSTLLHALPTQLSVELQGNFKLIEQTFPADGQYSYYVITPKKCMINTKMDPRNLDPELKKQYKNIPFIITNWNKPEFNRDGTNTTMTVRLKITKHCLACEVIGYATVLYTFDEQGKLIEVKLGSGRLVNRL